MKVINLKSENVKRIRAIDITPNGNTVKISGKVGIYIEDGEVKQTA